MWAASEQTEAATEYENANAVQSLISFTLKGCLEYTQKAMIALTTVSDISIGVADS
jgi:hypothetical protein